MSLVWTLKRIESMIGSATKYYFRPIIVDEGQLRYLSKKVKERFGDIEYGIETIDGVQYKYGNVDELLAYNNSNSRRIVRISIRGRNYNAASSSVSEISLSIFDRSESDLSCYMQLMGLEEYDIAFFKNMMDDFVKDYGVAYWWMYKPICYWSYGAIMYLLFAAILPWHVGKEYHIDISHNIVVQLGWSVFCMVLTVLLISEGLWRLFPAGGFLIGEQVKVFDMILKVRKRILGLITSVVVAIIIWLLGI